MDGDQIIPIHIKPKRQLGAPIHLEIHLRVLQSLKDDPEWIIAPNA